MPCLPDIPVVPHNPSTKGDQSFENFLKAIAGYLINQFFPFWPDLFIFKLINPLLNLYILQIMVLWPLLLFPQIFRHINHETRRYFRRKTIGKVFSAAPDCREEVISHLWMQSQRRAYLDDFLGGWYSTCYRYLYHYEIVALKRLAEAKDKQRTLLYLGFVDASRFGSENCEELHDHLTAILAAWVTEEEESSTRCGEKRTILEGEKETYTRELQLIRAGEELRRIWIEERKPTANLGHQHPEHVRDMAWNYFGGDNLDFVEYGPSFRRLWELVDCKDTRRWGAVWPALEYVSNWYYILTFVLYFAHKGLFGYLAVHGYYDITWEQFCGWLVRTWPFLSSS